MVMMVMMMMMIEINQKNPRLAMAPNMTPEPVKLSKKSQVLSIAGPPTLDKFQCGHLINNLLPLKYYCSS